MGPESLFKLEPQSNLSYVVGVSLFSSLLFWLCLLDECWTYVVTLFPTPTPDAPTWTVEAIILFVQLFDLLGKSPTGCTRSPDLMTQKLWNTK